MCVNKLLVFISDGTLGSPRGSLITVWDLLLHSGWLYGVQSAVRVGKAACLGRLFVGLLSQYISRTLANEQAETQLVTRVAPCAFARTCSYQVAGEQPDDGWRCHTIRAL